MKLVLLCAFALAVNPATLQAGITIHFEGKAKSPEEATLIVNAAKSFSEERGWKVVDASSPNGTLERVIDEKNKDYQGRIIGIRISPSPNCEPIHIQFGDDLFMQDFVKTQFAGAAVHIEVISLFDKLKPDFSELKIEDEGEYWDTRNAKTLEEHISTINSMIEDMKKKNPSAKGPVFLPSGRIADLTE